MRPLEGELHTCTQSVVANIASLGASFGRCRKLWVRLVQPDTPLLQDGFTPAGMSTERRTVPRTASVIALCLAKFAFVAKTIRFRYYPSRAFEYQA